MVLDVELDADRHEVALHDRFNIKAQVWEWKRRVLELQALPALRPHPISARHPAVVGEQFVGRHRIKQWTGAKGTGIIAWMQGRWMVGAQWTGEPAESQIDQGLVINRHGHRLA